MHTTFQRLVAGAATLAVAATGLIAVSATASAAPAGTPADGPAVVSPATGAGTSVRVVPSDSPGYCPGSTAIDGYNWQTFMTPTTVDPATLTYNNSGPVPQAAEFTYPLYTTAGAEVSNKNTTSEGAIVDGLGITSFAIFGGTIVPGDYWVGIACSKLGQTSNFWASQLTIAANGSYAPVVQGTAAATPTDVIVTPGNGSLAVGFTPGGSDPADTSYEVTASDGGSDITAAGTGSPITVTGLTNGVTYDVTVTATNSIGTSAPSTAVQGTPAGIFPAAPMLNSVTPQAGGVFSVVFTPNGAADSYTATATDGTNSFTGSGTESPVSITGLTPGIDYQVSVVATNSTGDSAPSNAVSATAVTDTLPPATAESGKTVPTGDIQVDSFGTVTITVNPTYTVTDQDFTGDPALNQLPDLNADEGVVSADVPLVGDDGQPLPAGTRTVTITGTYNGQDFVLTITVTVTPAVPDRVVIQKITVTRPQGALILTQRCGVYGALPAWAQVDAFPGYPYGLGAAAAAGGDTGTAPTLDEGLTNPDPEFPEYPAPSDPNYPTYCALDLGTAEFVTDGALAGDYFAADGRLNQVSVFDNRDDDLGWTATGTMGDFTDGGDTFSGNYLGWDPEVTSMTASQVVVAGDIVLPGTGVGAGSGLAAGQTLAYALPGDGHGIAELDARVALLIPTEMRSGDYTGLLTISVV